MCTAVFLEESWDSSSGILNLEIGSSRTGISDSRSDILDLEISWDSRSEQDIELFSQMLPVMLLSHKQAPNSYLVCKFLTLSVKMTWGACNIIDVQAPPNTLSQNF